MLKNFSHFRKSPNILFFIMVTMITVMIIPFQNCSPGYQSTTGESNDPSLISDQDSLVPVCNDGDQQNGQSCAVTNDLDKQSIAASSGFTCWIDDQSSVQCTGNNSYGKLGNRTNVNSLVPVNVSNLQDVRKISLGYQHACAIDNQSRAWCWGQNNFGQLGNNSKVDSFEPVLVLNLPAAKEISAGENYTCAVDFQGQAYCWGSNLYGQLGNNTTLDALLPLPVANLKGATNISATSGGTGSTCALTATRVYCWGDNRSGQLGNNSTVSSLVPVLVQNIMSPRQIDSGFGHHCALDGQSHVWCWGRNAYGQLGTGNIIDSRVPVAVVGLEEVKQLDVKYGQSCVIDTQDRVLCWGSRGVLDATVSLFSVPAIVPGLSGVEQIAVGFQHTCAIDSQKRVYCWGYNTKGAFGNDTIFNSVTPIQVR